MDLSYAAAAGCDLEKVVGGHMLLGASYHFRCRFTSIWRPNLEQREGKFYYRSSSEELVVIKGQTGKNIGYFPLYIEGK